MPEIARFAVGVLGTLSDPVAALGYIVAGVASNRSWKAAIWGLAWAVAADLFARFTDPVGYQGQYVALRIVAGVIVATAVFGIKVLFRAKPVR